MNNQKILTVGNTKTSKGEKWLIDAGFHNGAIYTINYNNTGFGSIEIILADKGRKVAGNINRPIIDLNSKKVTQALHGFDNVNVLAHKGRITITGMITMAHLAE